MRLLQNGGSSVEHAFFGKRRLQIISGRTSHPHLSVGAMASARASARERLIALWAGTRSRRPRQRGRCLRASRLGHTLRALLFWRQFLSIAARPFAGHRSRSTTGSRRRGHQIACRGHLLRCMLTATLRLQIPDSTVQRQQGLSRGSRAMSFRALPGPTRCSRAAGQLQPRGRAHLDAFGQLPRAQGACRPLPSPSSRESRLSRPPTRSQPTPLATACDRARPCAARALPHDRP